MKSFTRLHVVFIFALLLVSASAFAARDDSHKGSLNLTGAVQISGHQLTAGQYEVKWQGNGPTAAVDILQHGKVVVSTNARIERLNDNSPYDSTDEITGSNGGKTLSEVRFSGQRYAVDFTGLSGKKAAAAPAKKS